MKLRVGLLVALTLLATAILAQAPSAAQALDYDCADFANQAEAQEYAGNGDPYGLDGDDDGVACEDLPCPCSTEAGGDEATPMPPPPPPYHLTKGAARSAARAVVAKFVRRSPRVASGYLGACHRLGERRVDCQGTARGRSGTVKTTCRLRVAVRAVDHHPKAQLSSVNCRHRETEGRRCASRRLQQWPTHLPLAICSGPGTSPIPATPSRSRSTTSPAPPASPRPTSAASSAAPSASPPTST